MAINRGGVQHEPANETPSFQLGGEVRSQDGELLNEMNVAIRVRMTRGDSISELLLYRDVLAVTMTDAQGKFSFSEVTIPPRFSGQIAELLQGIGGAQLLVWGAGYAMETRDINAFAADDFEVELRPSEEVKGVVLQEDNTPLSGARISVSGWTDALDQLPPVFDGPGDISLFRSQIQLFATTDSMGQFQISSIPSGKRVSIVAYKPGFNRSIHTVDTGKTGRTTIKSIRDEKPLIQSPMTLSLPKTPSVDVLITDRHGHPVSAGFVAIIDSRNEIVTYPGIPLDQEGRVTLNTRPTGKHTLIFSPDPFHPHPSISHEFEVEEGKSQELVIRMPPITWVEGKVLDANTQKPLVAVPVGVFAKESTPVGCYSMNFVLTQNDGSYKLPVIPGQWRIAPFGTLFGYSIPPHQMATIRPHIARSITVSDSGTSSAIQAEDLKLTQGLIIEGQVLDQNGQFQPDVIVNARQSSQYSTNLTLISKTDADGRFQISGLSPTTDTEISAMKGISRAELNLEKQVTFDWKQSHRETISMTLKPTKLITGRLMFSQTPLKNIHVEVTKGQRVPNGMRMSHFASVTTNDQGIFEFAGLNEGDDFSLKFKVPADLQPVGWHDHLTVSDESPMKLPDVTFVRAGQILSGQVVDRMGQPVPGITVSARLRGGYSSLRRPDNGPPPWIDTDDEGNFTLTNLPEEPIELMAYKGNPKGGVIHYPAKANPKLNEKNIRILLDPALNTPIENLDPE